MSHHLSSADSFSTALKGFALLLLALFATELAVMGLLSTFHATLDPITFGLIDAVLLCFFLAWPLWYFVTRSLFGGGSSASSAGGALLATLRLWFMALLVVSLAEFSSMQLLAKMPIDSGESFHDLVDAALTTVISAPFLWQLLFRPGMRRCRDSLTDLLGTPFGLYVLLLYMVFVVDLLLERLLLLHFSTLLQAPYDIIDAIFTTLLLAPLLWIFVARPLRLAILAEHARVRAVHNQLIDAVVALNGDGIIESFNPAAEGVFGYATAEVVGRRADFLLAGEGSDLAALIKRAGDSANGVGQTPAYEVIGRRSDGSAVTLEVSLSQIELKGSVEYLLIMRDVSGRKAMESALRESKERFRSIFEQSEDAIVFFSPRSLVLIDVNATAEALFGRPRHELVTGGLDLLLPAPAAARLRAALNQLGPGRVAQLDTMTCLRPDGGEAVVSVRAKTMMVQKVELIYTTFRDVTERVRLETESREIQAKLIHTNKMTSLGLMVSGVAHEINNPNNLILANATILDRGWEDARKVLRDYARENGDFLIGGVPFSDFETHAAQLHAGILDGSRRINAIVNDLKGFARREQVGVVQEVDINQVATTAVAVVHFELAKYTGNFHIDLDEALPTVRGSSQQLGQVVVNLLMNSCQSLPGKTSGIWLTTSHDRAADEVIVSVRDSGCGMSPEVSRRIMEPFFTTRIDSGGTGLGLSISSAIVKSHQGSLTFTSTPGVGTEFTVRLPALSRATEDVDP